MAHCLDPDEQGKKREPIGKFTTMIDRALDSNKKLDDFDLSDADPPIDDWQWTAIVEVMQYTMEQYTPTDTDQWSENIDLRKLSLASSMQQLTQHSVPNLCTFIRKFRHLTHVNLSGIPLDSGRDITAALVTLPDLDTLVLKNCKIHPRSFQSIMMVFGIQPSRLRVLDVEHNTLNHAALTPLCDVMKGDNCVLTELNVGHNKVEITGLEQLMETMRYKRSLRVLDFSGNPGGLGQANKFGDLIASRSNLTDLTLTSSNLKGVQAVRLSQELKGNGEIRRLNLSNNPIGDGLTRQRQSGSGEVTRDYPAEFFSFLDVSSHSNVEVLILEKCSLQEDAGQALASVLHNNTKLTELVVRGNELAKANYFLPPAWNDMLAVNHYITKLDLSANFIGYQGTMKIFASLLRNRSIVELTLDGNALTQYPPHTDHVELVSFLENNTTMKMLSMCSMLLRDDLLVRLGEGLRRNRSLTKFLANNNEFTVRGVGEFARCLPDNTTLVHLDLSCKSVQISDELYLQAYKTLIESGNLETVLL
jgi:Ran GTPase-activating protein (RanGAP) involved in mRNA processing and transport